MMWFRQAILPCALCSFVLLIGCGREEEPEEVAVRPPEPMTEPAPPRDVEQPRVDDPDPEPQRDPRRDMPRIGEPTDDVDRPDEVEDDDPMNDRAADFAAMLDQANIVYDRLLTTIVTDNGLVDYDRLAQPVHRSALGSVISAYSRAPLPDDEVDRLAFWINAYNANVLKKVADVKDEADFDSVMQVEGFFDERTIEVGGETMTLNELLHGHIRPQGEPRVHAALVGGAMSSPPLLDEPYIGYRLDAQLDDQSWRWVNDPAHNRIRNETLRLSTIFNWYAQDYEVEPYEGVFGYVRVYSDEDSEIRALLREHEEPTIEWIEYDWTLNRAVQQEAPEK